MRMLETSAPLPQFLVSVAHSQPLSLKMQFHSCAILLQLSSTLHAIFLLYRFDPYSMRMWRRVQLSVLQRWDLWSSAAFPRSQAIKKIKWLRLRAT